MLGLAEGRDVEICAKHDKEDWDQKPFAHSYKLLNQAFGNVPREGNGDACGEAGDKHRCAELAGKPREGEHQAQGDA